MRDSILHLDVPSYTEAELEEYPWIEHVEYRIYEILQDVVQPPKIATSSDINAIAASSMDRAVAAASQIGALHPYNRPREPKSPSSWGFFCGLWTAVIVIVRQLPWAHPGHARLAELIAALRRLAGPEARAHGRSDKGGEEEDSEPDWQSGDSDYHCKWENLPVLDEELWTIVVRGELDTNLELLIARGAYSDGMGEWLWLGLKQLRQALENQLWAQECQGQLGGSGDGVVGAAWTEAEETLAVAAHWMIFAGQGIYDDCLACTYSTGEEAARYGANGRKWMGAPGFSIERWGFWRRCFDEISGIDHLSADSRAATVRAAAEMGRIERTASS